MSALAVKDTVLVVDPEAYGYGVVGKIIKEDANSVGAPVYRVKFKSRDMEPVWYAGDRLMKYSA
jgi:hypothetical protein